jgi:hypothetical protein
MKRFFWAGWLFCITAWLVACTQAAIRPTVTPQSKVGDGQMRVELDVFSGRPNPIWDLAPQEAAEFYRLFRDLPEGTVDGPAEQGLGYRGFVVTGLEEPKGCSEIVVFGERVAASCDTKLLQLVDKGRVLERWLLQTGKGQLDSSLYQLVLSEIEHD